MPTLRAALTGGIATGKSHCLAEFRAQGVPVVDADALAHAAIAPGAPGYAAVLARFGDGVLAATGEIDRKAMARIIFADARMRRELETIVHPIVYRGIERWFAEAADTGAPVAIADIPLLFETGREVDYDKVIVTTCPPAMQIERLMKRSAMSREDAERRIAAQIPNVEKVARADFVIDTSGTFEETSAQVAAVLRELRGA